MIMCNVIWSHGGQVHIRRITTIFFIAMLMLSCGKGKPKESSENLPFKFLVLAPGSFTDDSTNQRCYEALQKIAARLKLEIHYYENVKTGKVEELIEADIKNEYNFILALGEQLILPMINVAAKHKQIKSLVIGQYRGNDINLGAISYQFSHFYLAGVMAGLKTKSGKIGILCEQDSPQNNEEVIAFSAGVRRINPDIMCTTANVGSWGDKKKAAMFAESFKANHIDVIFVNCGYAGLSIYKWAAENRIMLVGSGDNQKFRAPRWVISSVVINYEKMLGYAIEQMLRGQWQGTQYQFGMAEKITDITVSRGVLTSKQEDIFYEVYREIAEQKGEIQTGI